MDIGKFKKELDLKGPAQVEEDLKLSRYRSPKKEIAELWRDEKKGQSDLDREDKYMSIMIEQLRTAKLATMAAWIAAIAAMITIIIA